MNKLLIRKIALFALLILVGYLYYSYTQTQHILGVYNQKNQEATDCLMVKDTGILIKGGHGETLKKKSFNLPKFVSVIQNINTSSCPKKFQLAWLDYVQACQRASEQTPNADMLLYFFGIITRTHTFDNLPSKPIQAGDELEKASQALDRVALEYNVRTTYKTN